MIKPYLLGVLIAIMATAFFCAASHAHGESTEDISFDFRWLETPCSSSLEGYWAKPGDRVDVVEFSSAGMRVICRGATIIKIPAFSELPRTGPCVFPLTIKVSVSEAIVLKQALSAKHKLSMAIVSVLGDNPSAHSDARPSKSLK